MPPVQRCPRCDTWSPPADWGREPGVSFDLTCPNCAARTDCADVDYPLWWPDVSEAPPTSAPILP